MKKSALPSAWLWALAGALLLLPLHWALRDYACDDAYIHLRIARNLLQQGRAYFNPGEAVMSSSSIGWTLLLGALGRIFPLGSAFLAVLNAGITLGLLGLWVVAAERWGALPRWAALGGALFVALPLILPTSLDLMESPLALALLLAGALAAERRPWLSEALLALAACYRPELALAWVLGSLWQAAMRKRSVVGLALASALAAGPFVLFDLWQFGTVIPNTIHAKALVYEVSRSSSLRALLPGWPGRWAWLGGASSGLLLGLAACRWKDGEAGARLLAAFGLLLALAYLAAKTWICSWYVPLVQLPFATGAFFLAWRSRGWRWLALLALALFMAPLWRTSTGILRAALEPSRLAQDPGAVSGARVASYRSIGAQLAAACPQATLLAPEIGGLGWAFPGRLVDACGLASPEALPFHPLKVPEERSSGAFGAIPPGLAASVRPDIIVSLPIFAEALQRAEERKDYRRLSLPLYLPEDAARLGSDSLWGCREILVWLRKDGRCSQLALAGAHEEP